MSEVDCHQVKKFSERCVELIRFREDLTEYLKQRMNAVAPNLAALIGDIVGFSILIRRNTSRSYFRHILTFSHLFEHQ